MKQLKNLLISISLVASLTFSWTSAGAVEAFQQAGPIGAINHAGFTVEQQAYRIAPGAKLKSSDTSRSRLSDLQRGDIIIFTGKVISGVYYVDLITYYAPRPI
jgi:hypothetical protein